MPAKRRAAASSLKRGNSSSSSQQQLSFNASKITKPHLNRKPSSTNDSDDARARKAKEAGILATLDSTSASTSPSAANSQSQSAKTDLKTKSKTQSKAEVEEEEVQTPPTPPLSPQSSAALALPLSSIKSHRFNTTSTAGPEIHTANLPLEEKILRHFDLTSRYGPCIGLSRKERWYRAQRLGLSPDLEVLRILLDLESGELKPELEEVKTTKEKAGVEKKGRGRKNVREKEEEEEELEPARVGKRAYIEELMGGGGVTDQ